MPPRRSGRRSASAYKRGDYIEYQYKGSTVTGKLLRKSANGTEAKSIWVVTPSDRRRKNEDIPETALGKVINAQEAMSNRGPKLKRSNRGARESTSPTPGNSDGSLEEPQAPKRGSRSRSGRGSPNDNSKSSGNAAKKRKSNDSNTKSSGEKASKTRKTVTFSKEAANTTTSTKKKTVKKKKPAIATSTRIGTRSTRGSGEAILLPELPTRKKKTFALKKVKKDENVTVVKMLTGTLYLYRGERRRAEFVRFK